MLGWNTLLRWAARRRFVRNWKSVRVRAWGASLGLLVLLVAPAAFGQRYPSRVYTEPQGLPSSTVYDVLQDETGFIWVATRGGIARYDGAEWVTWSAGPHLRDVSFGDLALGSDGRLWAVSDVSPFHLVVYDGGGWNHIASVQQGSGIPRDATVDLLVRRDGEGDVPILVTSQGRIAVWRGGESGWDFRQSDAVDPEYPVRCAVLDGDELLLGRGDGVFRVRLEGERSETQVLSLEERSVHGIARRSQGRGWWVAGRDWIGTWDETRLDVTVDGKRLCQGPHWCPLVMLEDPVGGLWVASPVELVHVDRQGLARTIGVDNGLGSEGAHAMWLDRQHNLWLAAERALTKLRPAPIVSYDRSQGLLADEVTSVLETRDGTIWLGHPGGLTRFGRRGPESTVALSDDIRVHRVMDLAEDSRGRIWIATSGGGLYRRDADGSLAHVELPGVDNELTTAALLIGENDSLWVGGGFGLLHGDGDRFEPVDVPAKLHDRPPHVRRIVDVGPKGLALPTVSDGLIRLHEGQALIYSGPAETHVNSVYTALLHERTVLAGSSRGLYRLAEAGGLEPAGPPEYPRVDRPVYFLAHDHRGRLWIGTDNGALCWDGEERIRLSVETGLPGHETNRDAGLADSQGRFWIGTNRGVSIYRDELEDVPAGPPVVELSRIELQGVEQPLDRAAEVTARTAGLVVSFHVLSFIDEERAGVESWLEGYEPGWQPPRPMARRELRYARLEPGTYRLHLRASAANGRAGPTTVTGPIVVDAPLWVSWWFRLAAAALLLGIALSGVLLVVQRRAAARLEQEVRRRTQELEESQRELQSEKETLSATLESAAEGVLALDPAGKVLLANTAAERILAGEAGELVGRPLAALFPELEPSPQHEGFAEAVERGTTAEVVSGSFEARLGEGLRAVEGSLAPIPGDSGRPHGAVFAFRDVTERRKLEGELARAHKLESLGLLAGGIAHDFNNLLTVLIGNLAMLEASIGGDRKLAPLVSDMLRAGGQAKALARQLLTFARGGDPMLRPTEIGAVVEQARAVALSGTGVSVRVEIPPDLPRAHADPGQLSQVLNNLLLNAVQAMGGQGQVWIRGWAAEPGEQGGLAERPAVLIEIEDDGPGIPAEEMPKIFDPYFSTKPDGSGLGLAIVHSVVRRHGGRVTAASEPGRGARVRLVLPAAVEEEHSREEPDRTGARQRRPSPKAQAEGATAAPRVLVMDDEPAIRRLIQRLLEELGCEVTICPEGQAAVDAYGRALDEERPYALVITDLTVAGGMGGEETARALLQIDPEARVVVASGYSRNPVMADPASFGFVDAIQKPFKPRELQDLLRTLVFDDDSTARA